MGLRTVDGIPLDLLDLAGKKRAIELQELDLLSIENSHIRLTLKGSALVDPIAAELV